MTMPRLIDDPSKARYGSMLRKAQRETLSPEAEARIAAAVLGASAAPAEAPGRTTMNALLAKGAIALSAIALITTTVLWSRSADRPTGPTPAVTPMQPIQLGAEQLIPTPAPAPLPSAAATLSVHDLPEAVPSALVARPLARAASDDSLGAEAAFLRSVREDIGMGRSADALRKLDQYDARFGKKGAMAEEAAVERVEALLQAGKAPEARALATRLLADRPNGTFARKLRSLVAGSGSVMPTDTDSSR